METLRQLQERWDGAGEPNGLSGDRILLPARVVAVANAFVAMVSPRAWRAGSSVDEAVTQLMAAVGKAFDRRVVAALVNYLDNRAAAPNGMLSSAAPRPTEADDDRLAGAQGCRGFNLWLRS